MSVKARVKHPGKVQTLVTKYTFETLFTAPYRAAGYFDGINILFDAFLETAIENIVRKSSEITSKKKENSCD